VLSTQIKPTFHKLNVHAALTPADIWKDLEPVFTQAKELQEYFESKLKDTSTPKVPFVTVSTYRFMLFQFVWALLFSLSTTIIVSGLLPLMQYPDTIHCMLQQVLTACQNFKLVFMYNMCPIKIFQLFLDEVNTSSCVGLFKEIIIDRTFDGNVSSQL